MANADCIVIQGSNMAECHPVGFQWVTEAKARGARVIHVDPRFTRTTALADKHVPIRAGSDVVLLGALISRVLDEGLYFEEYVRAYTNAATLVSEDFLDSEDLDGLFSGYDPETHSYDDATWGYQRDADGRPVRDETLTHPRSVFQILKRHYSRYTAEMVEEVCGISREDFEYLLASITENSGRERTTCWAYAVGWTQHTLGAQFIRTSAILQLLLGNMGRPGGGVMALRGHATIQGASDIPTLFNLLPGYIPMPVAGKHDTYEQWIQAVGTPEQHKGYWANGESYAVSLLKAWWGDAATRENDWAYDYLPRINGAHGTYQSMMLMLEDKVDGFFVFGQNPAVGSANGRMQRLAMSHLKWLVVRDFQQIETATWWKDGPEIESGELRTEDIETEVFFMPAANHTEKAGSFTQTQRMVQWRHQAVRPPGDARSDLEFLNDLGLRVRALLQDSDDPRDRPLLDLTWDYPVDEHGEPDAEAVLKEINGYRVPEAGATAGSEAGPAAGSEAARADDAGAAESAGPSRNALVDGEPLNGFTEMRADGSTAGGCWIYSGVYAGGVNQAARRKPGQEQDETAAEWGWAWPANRRILYNRASADLEGKPWSERKKLIWWDEDAGRWVGNDVPDFPVDRAPSARSGAAAGGPANLDGDDPFIMQADGKGWLFAPTGMVDGPLPTHYEPQESAVPNLLYKQQNSPSRLTLPAQDNMSAPGPGVPGSEVYPYVFTTYRLTEHHTAGGMSRWLPYLAELQPEMFCEVSPELAAEVGLEPYGWATIVSPRAAIEARVLVTRRMTPLTIAGRTVHQIGLPYHWGVGGEAVVEGDSTNDLLGIAMDPNVSIQAAKYVAGTIMPGRRPRGPERLDLVEKLRSEAGLTLESGNRHATVPVEDLERSAEGLRAGLRTDAGVDEDPASGAGSGDGASQEAASHDSAAMSAAASGVSAEGHEGAALHMDAHERSGAADIRPGRGAENGEAEDSAGTGAETAGGADAGVSSGDGADPGAEDDEQGEDERG